MPAESSLSKGGVFTFTLLALTAFAANSILCRAALRAGAVDAASFSTIRLVSGAVVLVAIARPRWPSSSAPTLGSALALVAYALPFAFAYSALSVGTGALLLFGAVQVTMAAAAIAAGERTVPRQWSGLGLAFFGLGYLVWPSVTAPPPWAAGLMGVAGAAWAVYTLRGRTARDPMGQTALNFAASVPAALLVSVLSGRSTHATPVGILLAVASGTLASGLGYAAWYRVLPRLSAVTASAVQLLVPVIAAAAGAVLLGEGVSGRFLLAAALTLGGVALASRWTSTHG